jgi:hypothetical protein
MLKSQNKVEVKCLEIAVILHLQIGDHTTPSSSKCGGGRFLMSRSSSVCQYSRGCAPANRD